MKTNKFAVLSAESNKKQSTFIKATIIIIGLFLMSAISQDTYYSAIAMRAICCGILAIGLDTFTGLAGQLSMGCAAFMGIGAYASSVITAKSNSFVIILIGFCCAVLFSGVISFALGYPLLRLKGDYLAFATLGFGEITRISFENMKITNGASGLYAIPHYSTPILCFIVLCLCYIFAVKFKKSNIGLFASAISDDETAAKACGVNTAKVKTIAFCVCGVICGIGGFLYSGIIGFISPGDFGFAKSVDILAAVVLGGKGSLIGPCLMAAALEIVSILLQGFAVYKMIIFAVLLIVVTLYKYKERKTPKKQIFNNF